MVNATVQYHFTAVNAPELSVIAQNIAERALSGDTYDTQPVDEL